MIDPKKLIVYTAMVCALGLGVAACGGGNDGQASEDPGPEPPAPTETSDPTPPSATPDPAGSAETLTEPGGGDAEPPSPVAVAASGLVSDAEVPIPTSVPADAIAVVGTHAVERSEFDLLISQREQSVINQGGEFAAVGTAEYEEIKNQQVAFLIQRAQFAEEAAALGITVNDEDVIARLDELKVQFFEGDEDRYLEELADQGLTEGQVLDDIRFQQISDALFVRVTEGLEVAEEDIATYYEENQEAFEVPEQREVAHILVETQKEADDVRARADAGEDFAALAEETSIDEGTAVNGGAYTAVRGLSVEEFDAAAYALEIDQLSPPVKTQFGWHIIKALGDIEPASTRLLDEATPEIEGVLRSELESAAIDAFLDAVVAKYEDKVLYAPGFEPPRRDEPPADEATVEESTP